MKKMEVRNPILWTDLPDPDVLRIGDTYYMVSTTMYVMPGGPVLKSKDLCHWEIVSYIFDILENNEIYRLENGKNAYGKGQWATSLKFHNGRYYACFVDNAMQQTYIYYTEDIEKSGWERYVLEGIYHDMSLMFDEGRAYFIYNGGDIKIIELKEDLSDLKSGGVNRLLFRTPSENIGLRCEGCRAYKINGYYYLLFIDWPSNGNKRRRVVCYRSETLLGEYECKILLDDDMGYKNQGVAQGVLIDTPQGDWYALLFQDHGAVGRIPYLLPAGWVDSWPVIGRDGKVPQSFEIPFEPYPAKPLVTSDSFDHSENRLDIRWQWNHNPEEGAWSFLERAGYLRLWNKSLAGDILSARNVLTQRTVGPGCVLSAELDTAGMEAGDYAGLVAFQSHYGVIGVKADKEGKRRLVVSKKDESGRQKEEDSALLAQKTVFVRIVFDFEDGRDMASFYYSLDNRDWLSIGKPLKMLYTLDLFTGYRIGLFSYATEQVGGCADFRNFSYCF